MNECDAQGKLQELDQLKKFLEQQIRLVDDEAHVIQQAMKLVREPTEIRLSPAAADDDKRQRRSHIEIAHDVALANGGQVHLTSVAKMIIASGMSDTKKASSVAANLHKAMAKSSNWEWIKPGIFRLLSYEPPAAQASAEGGGAPADREAPPSLGDIRPVDDEADT